MADVRTKQQGGQKNTEFENSGHFFECICSFLFGSWLTVVPLIQVASTVAIVSTSH